MVVDASALIEVLLRTSNATVVEERLFGAGETLHVPYLIDIETAQVVRRYAAGGEIDDARGRAALRIASIQGDDGMRGRRHGARRRRLSSCEALGDLADFPMRRYPHDFLLQRVWDLRHNLTAYDAVYVALAEALDATLLTRDRRLAAASGHRARIEMV